MTVKTRDLLHLLIRVLIRHQKVNYRIKEITPDNGWPLQEVDYQQMEADNLGEDWDCLGNFFDICDSFITFG